MISMSSIGRIRVFALVFVLLYSSFTLHADIEDPVELSVLDEVDSAMVQSQDDNPTDDLNYQSSTIRRINNIVIMGNKLTPQTALIKYIPFKVGEIFDQRKTRDLIRNLYFNLKRFRTITVKGELVGNDLINIYIIVEEKIPVKDFLFEGNKHIPDKELKKALELESINSLDPEELKIFGQKIQKQYLEKGYHDASVESKLTIDVDDKAIVTFVVHEGEKSVVKQIEFIGNEAISGKELRSIMITREDWLLSFLDKSGTYQPERIEADKHFIGRYYQNQGFLQARVIEVKAEANQRTHDLALTYEVEEGHRYRIKEIKAPGNEILSEEQLLARLPVRPGQYYSVERIADTMKVLEQIWGNQGYIFAHVDPSIEPDDETKTVNLTFYSELGNKIRLNKVNIKGNRKTRQKVIRRKIVLAEGELITQAGMDISKRNVESLGYFDARDGVNWKITRLAEDEADLDLILKESKTGNLNAQIGFGGAGVDLTSPVSGLTFKGSVSDTNLFGSGIQFNFDASWSKDETTASFHLAQPWLMDKPISGALDLYHRRPTYDQFRNVAKSVHGKLTGGGLTAGFITRSTSHILNDTSILFSVGVDNIKYETKPAAVANIVGASADINAQYQLLLNQEFDPGTFAWFANSWEQDHRNHPMHTSRGHKWKLTGKLATPAFTDAIGFFKCSLDAHWWTPLINEYDLVFHLRGFLGIIHQLHNRTVPYSELYHVGGPGSVRGYLFGQIGPKFAGDPVGATRAFFWTAELVFPITPDFTMKGCFFYDGGTGFNAPPFRGVNPELITNNHFDYRHAIGVGLYMLQPMPIKIDWGFKIDPRKGESASEVHFGMNYDW